MQAFLEHLIPPVLLSFAFLSKSLLGAYPGTSEANFAVVTVCRITELRAAQCARPHIKAPYGDSSNDDGF